MCRLAGYTHTNAPPSASIQFSEYDTRWSLQRISQPLCRYHPHWCLMLCGCVSMLSMLASHVLYWSVVLHVWCTFEPDSTCQSRLCSVCCVHQVQLCGTGHLLPFTVRVCVERVCFTSSSKTNWLNRTQTRQAGCDRCVNQHHHIFVDASELCSLSRSSTFSV